MPICQCYPPQGLLTKAAKTQIAAEIAIHCNDTGAPRSFVNVLFLELPEGCQLILAPEQRHLGN